MNLEQTTVPLVPRTTFNCLDLAVRFAGQHFLSIAEVWLTVALPACCLVYVLSTLFEIDVRLTLAVIFFATWPLGTLLIAGTTRSVFGEPFQPSREPHTTLFSLRSLIKATDAVVALIFAAVVLDLLAEILGRDLILGQQMEVSAFIVLTSLLTLRLVLFIIRFAGFSSGLPRVLVEGFFRRLAIALGPALLLFPINLYFVLLGLATSVFSLMVLVRKAFQPETAFLAQLDRQLRSRRTKDLLKLEGSDLFMRGCWITSFCSMLSMVLFRTVDWLANLLFGFPILMGRLKELILTVNASEGMFEAVAMIVRFIAGDPRVLTTLTLVALFVYPIGRLAWFFCYIDIRVRRDLWDLEIVFQREALRLEGRTK